ncbi:hypothetical protein EDC18_103332 [Natranaerovirga pectinivora]|uniref:DUF7000 domain-containing protein n=1 Tax=Natranaerovirga pectinivora TaxID=682400 RepID=A0A4R3MNK5_9FIRM|nr:hypothetical protein [Natranaerovirga pectinivora]TCT15624.1 hypothetical protein EDC18_103332 [Natranaerovirga pectinivora]
MKKLSDYVNEYKEQLKKGDIQQAYDGLVKYVMRLRTNLSKNLSDSYSFGNLFQGYMDYTYFYYSNDFLKKRKLKLALVLNHINMQFEIWLLGQTAPIQEKYWQSFKTTKWNKDRDTKPKYSVLETVLIENPNFNDLDFLSQRIEEKLIIVSSEIIDDIKEIKLT